MSQQAPSPSPAAPPAPQPKAERPHKALPVAAEWTCETAPFDEKTKSPGPAGPIGEITVGTRFVLSCKGPGADLMKDKLELVVDPEQIYSLRMLETLQLESGRVQMVVTSYTAAAEPYVVRQIQLTDTRSKVALGDLSLTVKSVLKEGEPPAPVPPRGPLLLDWPGWLWGLVGLAALVALTLFYLLSRRSRRRRRVRELLAEQPISLSPYNQFNREIRALGRRHTLVGGGAESGESVLEFVKALDTSYRWYLMREFVVPAFEARPREIAAEVIRQERKLGRAVRHALIQSLKELHRGLARGHQLNESDARQILDLCRRVADQIAKGRGG
jgi:hypothetical protein